jgi:CDP-glucose 4,6-dehydratase
LSGYLLVAQQLLQGRDDVATAWNFGPSEDDVRPVGWIVQRMLAMWGSDSGWQKAEGVQPHEAMVLRLDSSQARSRLGWKSQMNLDQALASIVEWHSHVNKGGDARNTSMLQLTNYIERSEASMSEVQWA